MSEQTATAQTIKRHEEEIKHRQFEYMAEDFFRQWQPKDPHDAAIFSAQLFSLVRQIHMDSVGPYVDQLTRIISVMPFGGIKI